MSKHFEREIERLNRHLIEFGDRVENQVKLAMDAIKNFDAVMSNRVIDQDRDIDQMEVELEEECLKLLALHQPVANDLRLIVIVLKINNDLERIGDHAKNIADRARLLASLPSVEIPPVVFELAKEAKLMLRKSLLALIENEIELAQAVLKTDDLVDDLNERVFKDTVEKIKAGSDSAEQDLILLSICRQLERIGDHACNIAEDVVYMLTGDIIRHSNSVSATIIPAPTRKVSNR